MFGANQILGIALNESNTYSNSVAAITGDNVGVIPICLIE